MIQFNLLPDVKLEFIKARRNKRLVMVSSVVVIGASLGVLILLFMGVSVFQKKHMNDLSKDIKTLSKKLQDTPDLNKALTVQNQITSLNELHSKKPITSRFFTYINQITPSNVTISNVSVDLEKNTIAFSGNAPDLTTINKLVDTLKFTKLSIQNGESGKSAFTKVVLGSYSIGSSGAKSSYQLSAEFDPALFEGDKTVTLEVPKQTTTRSETEKPKLFEQDVNQIIQPTGSQ